MGQEGALRMECESIVLRLHSKDCRGACSIPSLTSGAPTLLQAYLVWSVYRICDLLPQWILGRKEE